MPTYDELVELARMCWREAQRSREDVARELCRMARQYQELPDISDADEHKTAAVV